MINLDFGEIRKIRGTTLETAAQYIGVSKATMIHFENNPSDINICDAVMLADLYGTDINLINFKRRKE